MAETINILGETYTILEDDMIIKDNLDGLAGAYDKTIRVRPLEELLSDTPDLNAKKAYRRELSRHEILHCIFRECGMERWQNDEELVTWISIMFPKMNEIFSEVGCTS